MGAQNTPVEPSDSSDTGKMSRKQKWNGNRKRDVRVHMSSTAQNNNKNDVKRKKDQTYSSNKITDMGTSKGSIIAPILFNIIVHDLPKALSKNTNVAQYADDIAIWVNTTLRKHTNKRVVNHVQKLYQSELNKLTAYMK